MKKIKVSIIASLLAVSLAIPTFAANVQSPPGSSVGYTTQTEEISSGSTRAAGQWIQASDGRWWYRHSDGSYTTNNWELINGEWYYFDSQGWMVTGTIVLNGLTFKLNSSGALYYTHLPVTRRRQEKTNWCWAACAEMVGKYINKSSNRSQTNIVTYVKGSAVNEGGYDFELERAIEYICSRDAVVSATPLTQANAWNEIMVGDPWVAHVSWWSGSAHAIVCYAFDKENFNGLAYFHDPWENTASYNVTYSVLLTGCNLPTGSGRCTSAIYLN